jgi:dihydrofolate reductase
MATPEDEIDWAFKFGTDELVERIMGEIGAVILGHRTFRIATAREGGLPYGGRLKVPHFVVTHRTRRPVTIGGLTFRFAGDVERAVDEAIDAAGDKSVTLLGASIGQQTLGAGLVDEVLIHLVPILLGQGIRLFDRLPSAPVELERTEIVATAGVTSLRFRVVR